MLEELSNERQPVPKWLMTASEHDELPLLDILRRSMYYPACGYDGRAVQYFAGSVHSFVYVDLLCCRNSVLDNLNSFKGYRLRFVKDIKQETLSIRSFEPHENILNEGLGFSYCSKPYFSYAIWAVFERLEDFDSGHGPERFSLLYIGGEAVSVYWSLYWARGIVPFAITLIRCDGFTGNWTSFFNDQLELASLVMMSDAPCVPKYLLSGYQGRNSPSPWRWFSKRIKTFHSVLNYSGQHHEHLTVWQYDAPKSLTVMMEIESPRKELPWIVAESQSLGRDYHVNESNERNRCIENVLWNRQTIDRLVDRDLNPLEAAFFKLRLSGGCIRLECTTCGGRELRKNLELLFREEILFDLARLDYQKIYHFELEIQMTLLYVDARRLTQEERCMLSGNGVVNLLDRMNEQTQSNLHSRMTKGKKYERYFSASLS
jgi:hypothetical protein